MPEECEWLPGLWGWAEKAPLPLPLGILGHLALPSLPLLNCTGPFLLPCHMRSALGPALALLWTWNVSSSANLHVSIRDHPVTPLAVAPASP